MILKFSAGRLHAVVALVLLAALPCRAGLVIEVGSVSSLPGGTGSFDINLVNTDATTTYFVSSDIVQVELSGISGVLFTDATISTSETYVFAISSTTGPPASPLSLDTFPTTTFTATDAEFSGPDFYRAITPGAKFGLVHVTFWVDPSAQEGVGSISIITSGTSLADADGVPIEFSTRDGQFVVTPEPSTVVSLLVGTAVALLRIRRGTRRES